jgi:putative endonuclease
MSSSSELGRLGESQALEWFLAHESVKLIARNYRCSAGEIDLIFESLSQDPKAIELIFVEVKVRKNSKNITGVYSLGWRKQQRMKMTIQHFLLHYRGPAIQIRIDFLGRQGSTWEHRRNLNRF